jgi:hypothetical protein
MHSVYTHLRADHYGFVYPPALVKWILHLHWTSWIKRFAEPAKPCAVENGPCIFLRSPTDNPTWNLAIYVDEPEQPQTSTNSKSPLRRERSYYLCIEFIRNKSAEALMLRQRRYTDDILQESNLVNLLLTQTLISQSTYHLTLPQSRLLSNALCTERSSECCFTSQVGHCIHHQPVQSIPREAVHSALTSSASCSWLPQGNKRCRTHLLSRLFSL